MLHALPPFLLLFARALARPPSREKRLETETLLTLLSSHISLTRTFRERIFRPRGACPRTAIGTSNGPAPELCDAFNFIYTAAGYIPSTERGMYVCVCVCVFARYRFRRARDIPDTRSPGETLYSPDAVSAILEKRFRNNSTEFPHVNYKPGDNSVLLRARCLKNSRDWAAAFVVGFDNGCTIYRKAIYNNAHRVNLVNTVNLISFGARRLIAINRD